MLTLRGVVCSLGPLVCRIQDSNTETILNELCSKMLTGKAEPQRDLAAIGIKGVIAEAPPAMGPVVTRNLSPKLINGVKSKVLLGMMMLALPADSFQQRQERHRRGSHPAANGRAVSIPGSSMA